MDISKAERNKITNNLMVTYLCWFIVLSLVLLFFTGKLVTSLAVTWIIMMVVPFILVLVVKDIPDKMIKYRNSISVVTRFSLFFVAVIVVVFAVSAII